MSKTQTQLRQFRAASAKSPWRKRRWMPKPDTMERSKASGFVPESER